MVPFAVVILEAMPLTPNGKINHKGLPAPPKKAAMEKINALSKTEDVLVKLWAKLLSTSVTSVHDNFFELGGHSVLATQLTLAVSRTFGVELPLTVLFTSPTISTMASAIDSLVANHSSARKSIDLLQEAQLSLKIKETDSLKRPEDSCLSDPKVLLLTGATGFVGAFLLRDLLEMTKAERVYCLARAKHDKAATKRVKKNLQAHLLWKESYESRIFGLSGDLSKPHLGVSIETWNTLCSEVDSIYHNGAVVHWLQPYEALKTTNVGGTNQVLVLASSEKLKYVHYISTTNVFDTAHHKKQATVWEDDQLHSYEGIDGGYSQSKWVAEKMVMLARVKGIPVAIYRPGYITGDSKNGVWNIDDFLCRLCKGVIQMQAAPEMPEDTTIDMCAVDYVSGSIVHISLNPFCIGKAYNITNPNLYKYNNLFNSIRSFGYPITTVSYDTWREKLKEMASDNQSKEILALSPLVPFFTSTWPQSLKNPIYDISNVTKALEGSDIKCPTIQNLLTTYFSYFIQSGFVKPPQSAPNNNLNIDWNLISEGVTMLTRSDRNNF